MKKTLSIPTLKSYWDNTVGWRRREDKVIYLKNPYQKQIKEFVIRKTSGSLLVSGQRGAGKSSSVIHAVREVEQSPGGIFTIYLNALHFEALQENDGEFLKMLYVLKQLTKALENELKIGGYDIPKNLKSLLEDISFTEIVWKQQTTTKVGGEAKFSLGASYPLSVLSMVGGVEGHSSRELFDEKFAQKFNLTIEDIAERFSDVLSSLFVKRRLHNGMLPPIMYVLSKIRFIKPYLNLQAIEHNPFDKKLLFIIDELDCYDDKPEDVLRTIKKFKNLFTVSQGLFIFIVGKATYRESLEKNPYKTLFSERCFISTPTGDLFFDYLGELPESASSEQIKTSLWERFRWLLIAKSNHNFYDLIQIVKTRSQFDERTRKVSLPIPNLSKNEMTLVNIHYALNEIYKFHLHDPIYKDYDDVLFDELKNIRNSYENWVHGQGDVKIQLIQPTGQAFSNPEVIGATQAAQRAYIRYLYKLADQEAPATLDDPGFKEMLIPWTTLTPQFYYDKIKRGVEGPVTDSDIQFNEELMKLDIQVKKILHSQLPRKSYDDYLIGELLKEVGEMVKLSIPNDVVESVEGLHLSIKNERFYARSFGASKIGLENLNTLKQLLLKIHILKNHLIMRTDWGAVNLDGIDTVLGSDNSHGSKLYSKVLILPELGGNDFEVRLKVKLSQNSLLNILLGDNGNVTPEADDKFYMVRVDSRGTTETKGNGILFKDQNTKEWSYVDGLTVRQNIASGRWVQVNIKYHNAKLEFTTGAFLRSPILSIDVATSPKFIGLANELAEVRVRDLVIRELTVPINKPRIRKSTKRK